MTASSAIRGVARHGRPGVGVLVCLALQLAACGGETEPGTPQGPLADLSRRDFATEQVDGCLAAGCHQQLAQRRWVHGPTATHGCASCHELDPTADSAHRFASPVPARDLCLRCHAVDPADEYIHEPYGSANCVVCHDPHGGARKDYLLTDRVDALCLSCHPGDAVVTPHEPRERGECLSCHEAHTSRHEHLLLRHEDELCIGCHREFRGILAENLLDGDLLGTVHPALFTEGCLACHVAHGSQRPWMMRAELHVNCQRCHSDLTAGLEDAAVVHAAFGRDDSCILCHTPHASVYDALLADTPEAVCLQCHAEAIEMDSGRTIPSISAQIADAAVVHHPVAEGDCTVCHIAHFSPRRSLLRLEYPHMIYGEFSSGAYELCFQCHDSHLLEEQGAAFTDFRDGSVNLHFVHVNREKGRACDLCHDPHASDGFRLVRDYYPFGPSRWPLPLGFTATETGGSCTSACHEVESYTR